MEAEVRLEGSVAKNTWLSEEPDIDIFMQVPKTVPGRSLEEVSANSEKSHGRRNLRALPLKMKESEQAYISCISGAIMKNEYLELIKKVCFQEVKVIWETRFQADFLDNAKNYTSSIASITVYGIKPE